MKIYSHKRAPLVMLLHHNKNAMRNNGFSLVEMLMALLVASLLMAALAPVMIKKSTDKVQVITGDGGNSEHGVKIFEYDTSGFKNESNGVKTFDYTLPSGVRNITLMIQGAGGGGAGATRGVNNSCTVDTAGTNTGSCPEISTNAASGYVDIKVAPGMQNLTATIIGGGGGGGGGLNKITPTSQADCPADTMYLTSAQNGGTASCVTKFNAGDANGPSVALAGINTFNVGQNGTCNSNQCCYQGATSSNCTVDPQGGGYSGCGRTVCQRGAAIIACSNYAPAGTLRGGWRLPFSNETLSWADFINANTTRNDGITKWMGNNGLQICEWAPLSGGSPSCSGNPHCPASALSSLCEVHWFWADGTFTSAFLGGNGIGTGLLNHGTYGADRILSTRCATTTGLWSPKSGSGGSGGALVNLNSNAQLNTYLADWASKGYYLRIQRGVAGGANTAASVGVAQANAGNDGGDSAIYVLNSSKTLVGTLLLSGKGFGGTFATTTAAGILKSGSTAVSTGYTGLSYTKTDGNSGAAGSTTSGGQGATSRFTGGFAGGLGGTASTSTTSTGHNGSAPTNAQAYGAGGGGGSTFASGNGSGGAGAVGYVSVSYDIKRSGAGGGGGGGGGFIVIPSIPVSSGESYEISVGKGGIGGVGGFSSNANLIGGNGGFSAFKLNATKTIKANGGTGANKGDDSTVTSSRGTSGLGGTVTSVSEFGANTKSQKGEDGSNLDNVTFSAGIGNYGGKPGMGVDFASQVLGGCSGKYENSGFDKQCSTTFPSGGNNDGYNAPYLLNTLLMGSGYGQAGGGGGGGSNETYNSYGNGATGANGYVYIKW